ncbi:type II toxin-antitoxin system VapB family antitoxin [Nocardia vermiculata]|uniref:Ribbon-helix-helix protein, CopG family n=1 Tax=Nocardia vermiculata TaxID=257274 RepID=A0A846Y6Y9_9NOCA|nr:ribbon-helix-helix protein, CopG family [Nocardia vermiculata]NKY52449.1 ribbon-helix-helix protein, CopG family [Nocardia vermiculata]
MVITDILIRDIPDSQIEQIDRRAQHAGLSRSEFVRQWIVSDFRPAAQVTTHDLERLEALAQDLDDPDVIGLAWS